MPSIAQLIPLLGNRYEQVCLDLKIIQRARAFKTPADLMLLCLYHLINGVTLINISVIARLLGIGTFSAVAFMKKFALCGAWFKQISEEIVRGSVMNCTLPNYLQGYRVLAVDASDVVEKGRSGGLYRLHYAIDILTMRSDTFKITNRKVGESLLNFDFKKGDLILADRAYGTVNGITHCIQCGAEYIMRLRTNCFAVYDAAGAKIDFLSEIRGLDHGKSAEFTGHVRLADKREIPVRICVKRKDEAACVLSQKRLARRESKKQCVVQETTKEFNKYIVLATSLPSDVTADEILETYRYRWQVEIHFKRLKSILGYGDLPKKNPAASEAWLNGKIMVALLIEAFISKSSFPPTEEHTGEECLARSQDYVSGSCIKHQS